MDFRRTIIVDNVTPPADGTYTFDLPVAPLSHLNLTLQALNVAAAEATPEEICDIVTNVRVLYQGTSIIQMSARDLLALNHVLLRRQPIIFNQVAAISSTRALGLIIPMGRKPFNPDECFPESKAGDLQLQLTVAIAPTALTGAILQVEAVELPDARPSQHLKATTLSETFTATGDQDMPLPIRNRYAGILVYSSIVPTTTSWNTVADQLKLLADNTERLYHACNWESLHADLVFRCGMYPGYIPASGDDDIVKYSLIDFDPLGDSQFLLETRDLAGLLLRITVGIAGTVRLIPLEIQAV